MPYLRLDDHSLRSFIRASLQILRREHAGAFAAMVHTLGRGRLYIQVDDEIVLLRFGQGTPQVWAARSRDNRPPAVFTTRRGIVRLVDGELTILEAVRCGELEILASPDDLLRFERSLSYYLRGAVRCPSFPALLDRFRETA